MLITNDEEVYNRVKLMRSHGMTTMSYQRASGHATTYDIINYGYNYRMTNLQAALGLAQLEELGGFLETKRRNYGRRTCLWKRRRPEAERSQITGSIPFRCASRIPPGATA